MTACFERPEASYADLAAAEQAGEVRRGWIPDWIPRSARTLRVTYDLDSNKTMLSFRYDRRGPFPVPNICTQVSPADVARPPFKVSWWPANVPPTLATHSHAFFSCGGSPRRAFLAVAGETGEAYYWRP